MPYLKSKEVVRRSSTCSTTKVSLAFSTFKEMRHSFAGVRLSKLRMACSSGRPVLQRLHTPAPAETTVQLQLSKLRLKRMV